MKTMKMQASMAALGLALGIAGCSGVCKEKAAPEMAAAPAKLPSGTVGENLETVTAKVKAVDQKSRRVTLQRPDGSLVKFVAGDEVRNLAQVKVGDEVKVSYYESLAYEVRKPGDGTPGASVAEAAARAEKGEKPGGGIGRVTTVTATIAAIDKAATTVTLRGPEGELTTFKARNPDNLNHVAVGDLVDITYTEALALSVETPTKK